MTLDQSFEFTEVISSSEVVHQTFWDSTGTGNPGHSEIVVSELATGGSDPLFIRFTGANGTLNAGGDNALAAGEQVSGDAAWVSATNTANGVAGDTIQDGEVLDFDLFFRDPENYVERGYATFASGLTLTLDGVGNKEDLVVILKLADPGNPSQILTTRAIVVGSDDIYGKGDAIPDGFGAPTLDNNDGFVIIEANDYLQPGEGYVIVGAQLMSSSSGLTGSGIDLNRAVGDAGASSGSVAFGAATDDHDVVKITNIGVIRTVTDEQTVSLDVDVTVTDADGDTQYSTFHINPFHDPIVLDLDGDGIHFQALGAGAAFDHTGDGIADQTAWITRGDAILVHDANGNGIVDDVSEFVFHTDGLTDLQTLHALYGDTLDADDAAFGSFGVWADDGDGVFEAGEFMTLAEAGITSIGLVSDGQSAVAAGGDVKITGSGSFTGPNGTGTLVDADFRFVPGTAATEPQQRQHEMATIAAAAPALLVAASLDHPAISFDHAMVNLSKTGHFAVLTDDAVAFAGAPALAAAPNTGMGPSALVHAAAPAASALHGGGDAEPAAHIVTQALAASAEPADLGSSSQAGAGFEHGSAIGAASGMVAASSAGDAQMSALLNLSAPAGTEQAKASPELSAAREALAEVTGKDAISELIDHLVDGAANAQHGQVHGPTVTQLQGDHAIQAILHGDIAGAGMGAHPALAHSDTTGEEAALAAAH